MSSKVVDTEAERAVLGSVILDQRAVWTVLGEGLQPQDFGDAGLRAVMVASMAIAHAGAPVDAITLSSELRKMGALEAAGGLPGVVSLGESVATAANAAHYARIVKDRALARRGRAALESLIKQTAASTGQELVGHFNRELLALSAAHQSAKVVGALEAAQRFDQTLEAESIAEVAPGIGCNLHVFDRSGGLHRGDLVIVGGRPSMGKTALALHLLLGVCWLGGHGFLASCEMNERKVMARLVSNLGRVELALLRDARRFRDNADVWGQIKWALSKIGELALKIWAPGRISISDLWVRIRLAHSQRPLDVVVVDYLQLLTTSEGDNRAGEVSAISRELKAMAVECNCAVVALSQLNRDCEKRTPPKPMMADLRESGSLEQDADQIVFLYRPSVYDEAADEEELELIMAKDRDGKVGSSKTRFVGAWQRIED